MKMGFAVLFASVLLGSACSSQSPSAVQSQTEGLNGPDVDVTSSQAAGGSETSVAFGQAGDGTSRVVQTWNLGNATVGQVNGWSVSTDNGVSYPTQRTEGGFPWVNATQAPTMSDGSKYFGGGSDPNVIATGWPNQFAYVTLGVSVKSHQGKDSNAGHKKLPADTPIDIVVAVSNDGGMTFGPALGTGTFFLVSDYQSSAINSDQPKSFVDQPSVATEQGGTHVAWVSWDNINVGFNGGGKRPWIRRLHFHQDGTIDFGPVTEVRIDCNLSCVKFDSQNIAAACDTGHATTDDCLAGQETELITFPRVNNSPFGGDTALIDNQGQLTCSQTLDVEWRTAISQDAGVTWKQGVGNADGSTIMGEDPVWPNCIVPGARAVNGNNRGRLATVHDDQNGNWHAYWTKETFNGVGGAASGQRVFHTTFPDSFSGMASEEIAPIGGCFPGGPECFADQFMPSATWSNGQSAPSTHAVVWHDTRLDPATPRGVMWGAFSHNFGIIGSFSNVEVDQAGPLAPWPFTGTNGNTPWGDYEGMASDMAPGTGPTFFLAYGDNRLQGPNSTLTHVWSRAWQP
jgi:hypothetical protein